MRAYRLIILLILGACKATAPSSSPGSYSEDLGIHRPVMMPDENASEENEIEEVRTEAYTALTGHIKQELDSISKVSLSGNKAGTYVDGYVIQVYSGNSREEANQARSKMYEYFADLNPKVSYHQPNFRVKAGKFTNRLKANKIHQQVKEEFPRALLLPERFLIKYE